jgi:hypothetical protein
MSQLKELRPIVLMHSASQQDSIGQEPLEARSRREIFRHTCAVLLDMAPSWGDEGAVIVVTSPLLTRADVQSAFDQISEKYHVAGIDLRFDQQDEGALQAIFEPSRARREFLDGEPIDETLKGSKIPIRDRNQSSRALHVVAGVA